MTTPFYSSLYENLTSFGDFAELKCKVDLSAYATEIQEWQDKFVIYNPSKPGFKRHGLSITSLDGGLSGDPDLTSLSEHNKKHGTSYSEMSFTTFTDAYVGLQSLWPVVERVKPVGRTHILKLDQGGYFPPHRDGFRRRLFTPECFRVLVPLINCGINDLVFLLDDRRIIMEPGRAYFVDTFRNHSLFSYTDDCHLLVINVPCTEESINRVLDLYRQA